MGCVNYPYLGKGKEGYLDKITCYEKDFLKMMFYEAFRIRLIEEVIADRYSQDEMKTPIHLAIGQEAVAVASCAALKKEDLAFCGHRTHAFYLAKGGDLKAMLSELHCRKNGCCGSRGGSMHLFDKTVGMISSSAIVAGIIPIATGAALASQQRGEDTVTAVYFGDAAVEEGVFFESLNFAKLKNLPIVYVCENNYYSVCSPLFYRQHPEVPIYKKAEGFGVLSFSVEGNNFLEMHAVMQKAVEHARSGKGPVFIEAHTYRYRGHHGPSEDGHVGYRSLEEILEWKSKDPVTLFESTLLQHNVLSLEEVNEMKQVIEKEIEEGFRFALASPFPTEADLMTHVYSE